MSSHKHPSRAESDVALPRRRVCVIYHFFAHYRGAVLEELAAHGKHNYCFGADSVNYLGPEIEAWQVKEGITFIELPCKKLRGHIMWQRGMIGLAWGSRFDALILLGDPYWPTTWLAALLGRLRGKRVIFWAIGYRLRDNRLKGTLRKIFFKLPHALLFYGHFAKARAIADGIRPEDVHVVYNSLDYAVQRVERDKVTEETILQVRKQLFQDVDTPVAVCVSRLSLRRRLDMLLEAVKRLKERGLAVNVLLVGKGEAQQQLHEYAQLHGLRVHFYGPCYDESQLARLVGSCNVTVAPGLVGLTAMQSLAFGVPVISHDDIYDQAPESEAIVPGRNGEFFKHGDADALADAIERWTGSPRIDPNVRAACIESIERHYNPVYQRIVIDRAVSGLPADDLLDVKGLTDELRNVWNGNEHMNATRISPTAGEV